MSILLLLSVAGSAGVVGAASDSAVPLFALREMDMHLHAGLERKLPLEEWLRLAELDGRKAVVLLDHIELYRKSAAEYAKWAEAEGVPRWYPMGRDGHRALMGDFDRAAAAYRGLLVFKGWEIGEFELDEGLDEQPMGMAEVIGWHISPNHRGDAPDGRLLIRRIEQIIEVQKRFPVPMILFHPFPMRLEHLVRDAQKQGKDWKTLSDEECRFFEPGEQENVVRLLKGTSIYIEMGRGTEAYWHVPAMRDALIADVKPLADAGVKFSVSTDAHGVAEMKRPFHPEVYCEPCGIDAENANALVRELVSRRQRGEKSD